MTTNQSLPAPEVPGYGELQQQIHNAFRVQHPDWVHPDGDSPTCDSYESRFAELLCSVARPATNKKCIKIRNLCGARSPQPLDINKPQRESALPNQSYVRKVPWT